jgi:pyridinium-3,5-biscarboxylic acid mononucleotide sulfurtransferase
LLNLSTWDLPASPCLSSRFPYGTTITVERLSLVDHAEAWLRREGFREFRVRYHGELARLEITRSEWARLSDDAELRDRMARALHALGFRYVTLDLDGYRQGEFNAS